MLIGYGELLWKWKNRFGLQVNETIKTQI